MSSQIQEIARWKTISQGQCAFRTSNAQNNSLRCKHLFTNTAECHFVGCPIVQPNYVAIQRSYETIYLVTKDSNAKISETWTDVELPVDKNEAVKVVTEATKNVNSVLKEAVMAKFNHLYGVSTTIRESLKALESDED